MSETFARQWAILKMIPKYPRTTNSEVIQTRLRNEGLEAPHVRTIQRDLEMLSQSFPLAMVNPKKRPIQWHWAEGSAAFDIPALEPSEAVAMKLVEIYLRPLLPAAMLDALTPHFESADKTLKSDGGLGPARWTRRIRVLPKGLQLLPPKVDAAAQRTVYDALLWAKRLEIAYRPRRRIEEKRYLVNPLGIVVRNSVVYLVASLTENDEPRQFVLHRMASARVLEEPATEPKGFDLDRYIEQAEFGFPTGKTIRLVANFSKGAAKILSETPISANQTMKALSDDRVQVTATVRDSTELHWWLLSFGPEVEVASPLSLRRFMTETIKKTLVGYQK